MDRQQIILVRDTFALVQPNASQAATLFYARLFDADPTLQPLFRGDMQQQGDRLMTMIASAVGLLERPAALMPVLRSLGARHVAYGVADSHYATVGSALLDTLALGLGEAFSAAARQAWTDLYGVIAETMIAGAHDARIAAEASALAV